MYCSQTFDDDPRFRGEPLNCSYADADRKCINGSSTPTPKRQSGDPKNLTMSGIEAELPVLPNAFRKGLIVIPDLQLELTSGHKCHQQHISGYNPFPPTLPGIHQTHSSKPRYSHPSTIFPGPILVDQSLHRRFTSLKRGIDG